MNINPPPGHQGHSRKISTSSTGSTIKKRPHTPTISSATAQLLTSTKTLLKSLTAWASRTASVADVSGRFVKVGDDFKSLKKSYALQGLDVSDIKDIPTMLREVLEESLVLEPSQKTLDLFLPKVGQIVSELMKILKEKQAEAQRLMDQRKREEPSSRSALSPSLPSFSLATSPNPNVLSTSTPNNSNVLPTPKALKDPIAKLQSNQSLMRRGSKRFSAYQTSKILSMHVANNPLPHEKSIPEFTPSSSSPSNNKVGPLTTSTVETESPVSKVSGPTNEITDSPLQAEVAKNIKQSEVHQQLVSPSTGMRPIDSSNGDVPPVSITPTLSNNNKAKLFLKLDTKVKKVEIKLPTSMANIKVLFTQKFEYTPEGEVYPNIYAQDSATGVAYELEDVTEIQPGFILSLHEEELEGREKDQSNKLFQQQMEGRLSDIKTEIFKISESLNMKIDKLSDVAKSSPSTPTVSIAPVVAANKANSITKSELQTLRLQLSKARQQQSLTSKNLSSEINTAISLVQKFQEIGLSPQGVISDPYMDNCKSKVSNETETLVTKIDDLQDVIEALKLDLSKRGARPSHKQITYVGKEMSESKSSLSRLTNYMANERKNWNSRWQAELTAILDEQEFFKEQETIIGLLEEDLQGADETYELIVKCVDEMEKMNSGSTAGANDAKPGSLKASLSLPLPDPSLSANDVRNALLTEVQLVQPDHESRIEAIMKAEKLREKEKVLLNTDEFQEELGDFVGLEKLKKSGGVEEIERKRKLQDEQNLKNTFGIV